MVSHSADPTRPASITAIAATNLLIGAVGVIFALGGLAALLTLWGHGPNAAPAFLFDAAFPAPLAITWLLVLLAASIAQSAAGWGLSRLRPWSRGLAIACATFCLIAFFFSLTLHSVALRMGFYLAEFSLLALGLVGTFTRIVQPALVLWVLTRGYALQLFQSSAGEGAALESPASAGTELAASGPLPIATPNVPEFVFGPQLPSYRPTSQARSWAGRKAALLVAVGMGGLLLFALSTLVRLGRPPALPWFITLSGGLFCLGSALFERQRFFDSRRARGMRRWLGDAGARQYYLWLGAFLVLLSYGFWTKDIVRGMAAAAAPHPLVAEFTTPSQYDFHLAPIVDEREAERLAYSRTAPAPPLGCLEPRPLAICPLAGCDGLAVNAIATGAVSWRQGDLLRSWDLNQGLELEPLLDRPHWQDGSVLYAAPSGGGCVLAAISQRRGLERKLRFGLYRLAPDAQPQWSEFVESHGPAGFAVGLPIAAAVSADGRLAGVIDNERKWHLFELATGQPIVSRSLAEGEDHRIALSPDGSLILLGDSAGTVLLLRAADGAECSRLPVEGRTAVVAFSPDGRWAASGHYDHERSGVHAWEIVENKRLDWRASFVGYQQRPVIAFSRSGLLVASGHRSDLIRVWNLDSRMQVAQPTCEQALGVLGLAFSDDGSRLVAGSANRLYAWDLTAALPKR